MKIIIYTINDCVFSKQEKEYLAANQLAFEEKNLETNREFLTEMLAVSNNFAGTPVTKIEKDDGSIVVLKGFTKEEFDKVLALAPVAVVPPPAPTAQITDIPPLQTSAPTPHQTVTTDNPSADKLNSILNNLQQKAEIPKSPAPATAPPASST